MPSQIAFAQDHQDELALVGWFEELGAWEYLPRIIDAPTKPRPLRECTTRRPEIDGRSLVVFPASNAKLVMAGVARAKAFNGRTVTATPDAEGCYFEWGRTLEKSPGVYVVGGASAARLFFEPMKPVTPAASLVEKPLKELFRKIRAESPLVTEGKLPLFVAAHLAARWEKGDAELLYPNGTKVALVAKEGAKPKSATKQKP